MSRLSLIAGQGFKSLHVISGQKRSEQLATSIWLTLLSTTLGMAVADHFIQRQRSREEVERDALATIDRLLAEFGDRIGPKAGRVIAAIYIRYSTSFQDSFEAQLRALFTEATMKGFSITRESIFYDLGISGAKYDREGLTAIRAARKAGKFKVFIALATSRLARNLKTLLEVLDEEFVGNGIRCILVDQRLDSEDQERWKLLLPLLGWLDEIQRTNQAGYVRAAHRMLLARRIFYSSSTYGYGGEVIPNFFTKRGRPVKMIVVDAEMAAVVRLIFTKFNSGVSIGRIVKQLNTDSSFPRPPKSTKNRFSREFVKRVLGSQAYVGVFVYNDETDVSMLAPNEMRELAITDGNVFTFPDLQIVSDEEFLKAQLTLAENSQKLRASLRSPRSREANSPERPMLLNRFMFCPGCENQLVAAGDGRAYGCKTCKFHPVGDQFLYSSVSRRLTTDLIVKAICNEVLSKQAVVDACVAQFLLETERMLKPDPRDLARLKKDRKAVKDQLGMLVRTFSGDDEDLIRNELNEFRNRLRKLDMEIAQEQRHVDQVVNLPTEDEARQVLAALPEILMSAALAPTDDELDKARELICLLTGGRIEFFQEGEKKAQVGWLQARFKVNLAAVLMSQVGVEGSTGDAGEVEIVVDIRKEVVVNQKIALARQLYDQDLFENEIAKKLQAGRASVCNWIRQSFAEEGKEKPDGHQRRKRIEKARGLHHFQQISDEVFELAEAGVLLCEIAETLKTNRDVITESLRYAYEKRGLPWLDGRARRKSLDRKSR